MSGLPLTAVYEPCTIHTGQALDYISTFPAAAEQDWRARDTHTSGHFYLNHFPGRRSAGNRAIGLPSCGLRSLSVVSWGAPVTMAPWPGRLVAGRWAGRHMTECRPRAPEGNSPLITGSRQRRQPTTRRQKMPKHLLACNQTSDEQMRFGRGSADAGVGSMRRWTGVRAATAMSHNGISRIPRPIDVKISQVRC